MQKTIYLDHHASTPCAPEVVAAMLPYFAERAANPSSSLHRAGRAAADAVDQVRETIASAIGARPNDILFTSGATESNNLALTGLAEGSRRRRRIVTSAIEHKSVLEAAKALGLERFDVAIVPVLSDGTIDVAALRQAVTEQTVVVSVQAANNEIGTIQPVAEIGEIAHARGALFHCDAAQALGRVPVSVSEWDVDLLSASAHKVYGPKGVGLLYLRGGARKLPISPLLYGGGQEQGLRPGTLNVPGIVGFGRAVELALEVGLPTAAKTAELRDLMEKRIMAAHPEVRRNGAIGRRLPGNSSLTWPGVDAEALIANLPSLELSTGSACTSGAPDPSHVLQAIGLSRADAFSTIRIGIGKDNDAEQLMWAADQISDAVTRIRSLAAV